MNIWQPTMIKALFFDLDGTLVDTHMANYEAYNSALNEVGVKISYDDFRKSIGYQANTFLRWFAPGLTDDEYSELSKRKAVHYKETAKRSVPNRVLIDFLHQSRKSCKIVLVTTAKRENAMVVLKQHDLQYCFDDIICAEDVKKSKPSPECYELALNRNGLLPTEVLAFEDSQPGVEAAEKAGISVLVVKDFIISDT